MQICVLWICHCRHSLCLFSRLYFCIPRYFTSLQRSYWQKAKLVLNSGWNWSLILCRSFSACFGDAGPLNMALVVWVCLGEAGAFPGSSGLEHTCGPSLIWGLQFCLVGPGIRVASLWSGGGALIQLTHSHCFLPQI